MKYLVPTATNLSNEEWDKLTAAIAVQPDEE